MPRNVLHDVLTKEHRTIRQVPLPHGRRKEADTLEEDTILYEQEEIEVQAEAPSPRWRRMVLWGLTLAFLGLLGIALATSFAGATIVVTPKSATVEVKHSFIASKVGGKIGFETLPIVESGEVVIPADIEKKVTEKASGTIIIYNNFSTSPQRLVRNTRFETASGLIYRIDSSVVVPGKTTKDGRSVPGSLEATVFADSPGAEYNVPLSDFTVPGFKTDAARFAGFYARSKTPISGGFDGIVTVPSDKALSEARAALRSKLEERIVAEKKGLVPPGYVLFAGAIATKGESLPLEERGKGMTAVREKLSGSAYLFNREELAKAVASVAISDFDSLPVDIPNLDELVFALTELPTGDLTKAETIRFTLGGDARVIWRYDSEKLKQALAGKPTDNLLAALAAFPTVTKAELTLRPFWSSTFPDNLKKIAVKEAGEAKDTEESP